MKRCCLLTVAFVTCICLSCEKNEDVNKSLSSILDGLKCANNEILYTTQGGYPISFKASQRFGIQFVANEYANGVGKLIFNSDVTYIPSDAFKNETSFKSIVLPDKVLKIGEGAFYGCQNLESIKLPDELNSIGRDAFSGCNISMIKIPLTVSYIGEFAFMDCVKLEKIYVQSRTPYANGGSESGYWNAFDNIASNAKIYVPIETIDKYLSHIRWKRYADIIEGYQY